MHGSMYAARYGFLSALIAVGALAAVGAAPATAAGLPAGNSPFCIRGCDFGGGGGVGDCSFSSYQQCQASAAGRDATCAANPYSSAELVPGHARDVPQEILMRVLAVLAIGTVSMATPTAAQPYDNHPVCSARLRCSNVYRMQLRHAGPMQGVGFRPRCRVLRQSVFRQRGNAKGPAASPPPPPRPLNHSSSIT